MSLVMAIVCTDGIVVSGDFRRSRYVKDSKTGETKFEYYDDQHKIFSTSQNRIIGTTGNCNLESGELVDDVIKELVSLDPKVVFTIKNEIGLLASMISGNNNSVIEAGIENGKKSIFVYTPTNGVEEVEKSVAIGATEELNKYKEKVKSELQNVTVEEAKNLLRQYNELVALHDPTVSRECEFLTIT